MFMPHWPPKYPNSGRMDQILELIGNPQDNLPDVIHVTGTNGKGCTISFLSQIFQKNNYQVHVFTSPHLLRFNENFIISGKQITDGLLHELTEEIRIKLEGKINPGFFEYQTALAFLAFSRNKADICLIESGMGAKTDPTNILTKKLLSIITPISLDHQEFLGDAIEKIALDKAHIINGCEKLVCSPQNHIAKTIITNFARMNNIEVINYEEEYDFDIDEEEGEEKLVYVDLKEKELIYYNKPNIAGDHQVINLSTALSAVKAISHKFSFQDHLINEAIGQMSRIARLEKIQSNKFPNLEIWFDGAHNQGGAYALGSWIYQQSQDKKNIIIYGRSEGKDHNDFLQFFNRVENEIIFVEVKNEPCSETKIGFQKFLKENSQYNAAIFDDLESVASDYLPNIKFPARVIICGSFYLYRDLNDLHVMEELRP